MASQDRVHGAFDVTLRQIVTRDELFDRVRDHGDSPAGSNESQLRMNW